MQYRLRTLLILLTVGPPLIAVICFHWQEWQRNQRLEDMARKVRLKDIAWQAAMPVHRPWPPEVLEKERRASHANNLNPAASSALPIHSE